MTTLQEILGSILNGKRKRRSKTTLAGLRKRAAVLGVTIETGRDSVGRYYVLEGTGWADENFCTTHEEVEDKLERLAAERG